MTPQPNGAMVRFDFSQVHGVEETKQGNEVSQVSGLVIFLVGSTLFLEGKNMDWWIDLENEIIKRMNSKILAPGASSGLEPMTR